MHTEPKLDVGDNAVASEGLFSYLSERSPQSILAVSGTSRVVFYANPAFARLVGSAVEDLVGRPFAEVVPEGPENGCLAMLDRVFRTGTAENLAEQKHRQSGSGTVYWSYAMWPILDVGQRPVGVMIQVTDATETVHFRQQSVAMNQSLLVSATGQHKLTEIAEWRATQLQDDVRSRDHFLAVLSHELRTPLAAFTSGLQILKLRPGDESIAESTRRMLERQVNQLVRLVDDLLDVSRIATGKLQLHKEGVEVAEILLEAVDATRALIDRRGHQLTVKLARGPIFLNADRLRLAQVFQNLLNNAAKYSPPGANIRLSASVDGSEIEVSVEDTGIGLPADALSHIFEPFVQVDTSWRRTQGGLGIGLSLVKELVELHGGRVAVRSAGVGHGSEFLVRLPIEKAAAAVPAPPTEHTALSPPRRILIVDDNPDAAESIALLLKLSGHDVRLAHDGLAAVTAAREFRPALVLLDLGMPNVDGFEDARRIRSETWGSEPLLVALTGWGGDEDRQRTSAAGFDRHLIKPIDADVLTEMIAAMPT